MTALTEEKVVFAFAKAWNRLEPDGFLDSLAPDARYASQWVFDELVGGKPKSGPPVWKTHQLVNASLRQVL
jgi:hypothetical protein